MDSTLYAHSVPGKPQVEWEPLLEHLESVADSAGRKARAFGAESMAATAGWLHDLGKAKPRVQERIRGEDVRESHSGEGAKFAYNRLKYPKLGKMIAYCIAGHHTGLPNGINRASGMPQTPLSRRIDESENIDILDGMSLPELELPQPLNGDFTNFKGQFFTRMLFSALVDADFIETERFFTPNAPRENSVALEHLRENLEAYLQSKFGSSRKSDVNVLRNEVQCYARQAAKMGTGFFTFTVPTGGGKTLSSLLFSLSHGAIHNLRRVIYVIPYTAIIEQTADVFREALDSPESVLEHHFAFEPSQQSKDEMLVERMKLATENWDCPIIVTTAVQFFESMFSNRTQKCRKLHNIANSVIVLDEAQNLPVAHLRPCLATLRELERGYGCTILLCTATQPAIRTVDGLNAEESIPIDSNREIVGTPASLYQKLKRVETAYKGVVANQKLVELVGTSRSLIIVNSKKHARALYMCFRKGSALHLSTNMTIKHRRDVLNRAKEFEGPVVSTALIEAGVDIDFPQVWRSVAGIDSIAQAAGRCNREGQMPQLGNVFIFKPEEDFPPPLEIRQNAEKALYILEKFEDPLQPDAIQLYFQKLYWDRNQDLDSKKILQRINDSGNQFDFPFADLAEDLRLIDQPTCPLIIGSGTYGMSSEVRDILQYGLYAGSIAKAVQPYSVNIMPRVRDELLRVGAASIVRNETFGDQFVMLDNATLYDDSVGFSETDFESLGITIF